MAKKLLFVSRHAPYGSGVAREALDAVLAAAAYGQDLSLLFMDDGVFQLIEEQQPQQIKQKTFSANIPVLPLYEVEKIFVHSASLKQRGITPEALVLNSAQIQVIDDHSVNSLMHEQDQLLSF